MAKPSISDGKPSITNPILHLIGNSNTARPRNTSLHTNTSQIRNSDALSLPFTEVASKPSQLENNMKAAGFKIPADAMAEIDKITGFHRFERHVG